MLNSGHILINEFKCNNNNNNNNKSNAIFVDIYDKNKVSIICDINWSNASSESIHIAWQLKDVIKIVTFRQAEANRTDVRHCGSQ
jgi:hypothetical protein